jgi:hypothetical protein
MLVSTSSFKLIEPTYSDICLNYETDITTGANGFKNVWFTYVGVKKNGVYIIYPQSGIDGKPEKLLKLNENEYILIAIQDSGNGIAAYHIKYYNVFYINIEMSTISLANKLGIINWPMSVIEDGSPKDLLNWDVAIECNDENTNLKINIDRHKKSNNGDMVPYDTVSTNYIWDNKAKKYVEK